MAKKFQILAMLDYIFQPVTQVRYSTIVLYGTVLLQLTNTIFASSESNANPQGDLPRVQENALEQWLIARIVESLETINTAANSSALFWVVQHAGKGRNLSAKIFERRAETDRRMPSFIKLEDD